MPHTTLRLRRPHGPLAAAVAGAALALGATPALAPADGAAATTDPRGYSPFTLSEPLGDALPVTGALSDFRAGSTARVIVPNRWQRRSAPAGRLRFVLQQNPSCRYALTYAVRSVLAPAGDAGERALAGLPATGPRFVLDGGERGNRAFRVVRRPSVAGRVRVDGLWVGLLTRRADIAPAGSVAWTEIRVSATSQTGDECHAGTWREALGPAIGDSLAVGRTKLKFRPVE